MSLFDQFTANKIRDGDLQTFEKLVNDYNTSIFNYCLRAVNDYHQAEELTQEIFIKVYWKISSYNWKKASLKTWIYTITHNTSINSLRDKPLEIPCELPKLAGQFRSVEDEYLAKERLDKLHEALQTLIPEDRSLIILKDYLGFKYKEIGEILNLPVSTIKSRLHSVRMKIRLFIGDYYD